MYRKLSVCSLFRYGASRTRTGDLLGAIQALSQLSYSPGRRPRPHGEGQCSPACLRLSRARSGCWAHGGALALAGNGRYVDHRAGTAMSFRTRLTSFFVVIVILPMLGVGFLVFKLIGQSE